MIVTHAVAALKHTAVCDTLALRTARSMRVRVWFADVLREGFFGIALSLRGQEHQPSLKHPRPKKPADDMSTYISRAECPSKLICIGVADL